MDNLNNQNGEQGKRPTLKERFKALPTTKQVGMVMSALNGFVMGMFFSMLHMPAQVPFVPRILNGFLSGFISIFISFAIMGLLGRFNLTPKTLADKVASKFHINAMEQHFRFLLIQGVVMSAIMTFFIGGIFVLVMSKFNIMAFLMGFLLKDFWRDFLIGVALTLILHKPFSKIVKFVTGFEFL